MNIDELRELLQMLLGAGIKPMLCTQNVPVSGHAAKCGVLTEVFEQDIEDYVRLPKALVGNFHTIYVNKNVHFRNKHCGSAYFRSHVPMFP